MDPKVVNRESSEMDPKVVNRELLRKSLYENIINWLLKKIPQLRYKEVCHLLLRYVFNKNITKSKNDDPIFITTYSTIAEIQMKKDFEYSNIKYNYKEIVTELEKQFANSSLQIIDDNIKPDGKITLSNKGIVYNGVIYQDISNLAEKYPNCINYALALNIRYTYLKLLNHGLARNFKTIGYGADDATEGFASAFNHYFNNFHSAFPDLEKPFGSRGSFFDNDKWITRDVFVNPPFDESLMTYAMNSIYKYIEKNNECHRFIFTLPNWNNYPELDKLKSSSTSVKVYKKGELPFIDYMNNQKIIYPCDIAEIILETNIEKENVSED